MYNMVNIIDQNKSSQPDCFPNAKRGYICFHDLPVMVCKYSPYAAVSERAYKV